MTVLIYAAQAAQQLADSTLEALTVARDHGEPIAVVTTTPSERTLEQLATAGVHRVLHADLPESEQRLVPPVAQVLATAHAHLGADAGPVLLPSSFFAKEVAAHTSYLLAAGLLLDVGSLTRVGTRFTGAKRAFAGTWSTACSTDHAAVVTIAPNAVMATPADHRGTAQVEPLPVQTDLPPGLTVTERVVHTGSGRPDLAEAAVVVAGGRGTDGDFSSVEDLADELGAAIGTTRDCVDEGWLGHELQIGQTGVTIAPRVYIGAGISGAPHHHGGMQASGIIIAVNIDEEAPLVQLADYAIIGDVSSVLTEAAEAIRDHRAD